MALTVLTVNERCLLEEVGHWFDHQSILGTGIGKAV